MTVKLIVALDFDNQSNALALVDQLDPTQCALKVGSQMFTLFGADFVRILVARRFKVFLDLKFHDIPNTVAKACKVTAELGVWMMNVHASGGLPMMQAASQALDAFGPTRPLLIAVTVLTSMDIADLILTGVHEPLETRVCSLARLAQAANLDGVVSSAQEVPAIKAACGHDFLTITPGIRLASDLLDDQSRVTTPVDALKAGSDYIVVGRPITKASMPLEVVRDLLLSIKS